MQTTSDPTAVEKTILLTDLSLDEADLSEEAKHEFDYHREILHAFELSLRAIAGNDLLSPVGRHLFLLDMEQTYGQCKQVLNYMARNSELLRCSMPPFGPIFIASLPRTGSTLLYNLLACDPYCRAPLFTDMAVDPVPPVAPSNAVEHERRMAKRIATMRLRQELVGRASLISAMHPVLPIEEDSMIIRQAGLYFLTVVRSPLSMTEYEDWSYDTTNKNFVYRYHATFMQMLNSQGAPSSHWLLKWSVHVLFLDALLTQYPRAAIVMTHRRLEEVLPSFCRLIWAWDNIHFDDQDARVASTLSTRALRHIDRMIARIMDFRTRRKDLQQNIFDVNYEELIEQPIGTVRRLYEHFGLVWSEEFETAMSAWIRDNPQGKQGRLNYTLSEFGLTSENIQIRYAEYIKTFLSPTATSVQLT